MKIVVKAASQEEFDSKRRDLIKMVAGSKLDVEIRDKGESKPSDEKEPYYTSQAHILDQWNSEFVSMLADIKREIAEVIEHG